jgi:hypothetical protein
MCLAAAGFLLFGVSREVGLKGHFLDRDVVEPT